MAEPEQPNSDKDFPDASDNASFGSDSVNSDSQSNKSSTETNNNTSNDKKSEPIINETRNNEDAAIIEARTANRFTKYGLYVNAFLLLCTLGALLFTWISLNDARKKDIQSAIRDSTNDANNRIKDSIFNERDSIKYNITKIQFESSRIKDSANIGLAKKSLDAQINSLIEAQKQFEISSRPLIQIGNISLEVFEEGKPTRISFNIENLGKYPAKITKSETRIVYSTDSAYKSYALLNGQGFWVVDLYVSGENSRQYKCMESEAEMKKNIYDEVNSGKRFIYLLGKLNYINIATTKKRIYRFIVRISNYPFFNSVPVVNEDFIEN